MKNYFLIFHIIYPMIVKIITITIITAVVIIMVEVIRSVPGMIPPPPPVIGNLNPP